MTASTSSVKGYFSIGLWGKQDLNRSKVNIPLMACKDDSESAFPDNIRQDIPIGQQMGKYKAISILISGKVLPSSCIDSFDIVALPVDTNFIR